MRSGACGTRGWGPSNLQTCSNDHYCTIPRDPQSLTGIIQRVETGIRNPVQEGVSVTGFTRFRA